MSRIIPVPYISQTPDYPTGCESISSVMLLDAIGFPVSPGDFIDLYLPKERLCTENGILTGPDPNRHFVGSPRESGDLAYGCFAGPICRALRSVLEKAGAPWNVIDLTGVPTEILLSDYIDRQIPVIYWATLDFLPPLPGPSWRIRGTGRTYTWKNNEHCLLLTGYDETSLYFLDPWDNHGLISRPKELCELRHSQQYGAAVSVCADPA